MCLYDRRRYSAEALAEVARVHPEVLGADGIAARNAGYVEPAAYLCAHPGPVSPLPPDIALEMKLTEVSDLAVARRRVADVARILGLAVADIRMAEVAAGEVIADVFRHGIMPGQVRVWGGDGAVTVRVDSSGPGEAARPPVSSPRIWPGTRGPALGRPAAGRRRRRDPLRRHHR